MEIKKLFQSLKIILLETKMLLEYGYCSEQYDIPLFFLVRNSTRHCS
jgi:hypothetical protein